MPGRDQSNLIELRPSPIQGLGVFATERIEEATCIIEYIGERITHEEADRRYGDDDSDHPHVLLFTVDEETVIDGGVGGNEARYFNHSCEPNCEAVTDSGRVFINALRTIPAGEELTYDYQLENSGEHDPEDDARYACQCGTKTCRGTMMAPPGKPDDGE